MNGKDEIAVKLVYLLRKRPIIFCGGLHTVQKWASSE